MFAESAFCFDASSNWSSLPDTESSYFVSDFSFVVLCINEL